MTKKNWAQESEPTKKLPAPQHWARSERRVGERPCGFLLNKTTRHSVMVGSGKGERLGPSTVQSVWGEGGEKVTPPPPPLSLLLSPYRIHRNTTTPSPLCHLPSGTCSLPQFDKSSCVREDEQSLVVCILISPWMIKMWGGGWQML